MESETIKGVLYSELSYQNLKNLDFDSAKKNFSKSHHYYELAMNNTSSKSTLKDLQFLANHFEGQAKLCEKMVNLSGRVFDPKLAIPQKMNKNLQKLSRMSQIELAKEVQRLNHEKKSFQTQIDSLKEKNKESEDKLSSIQAQLAQLKATLENLSVDPEKKSEIMSSIMKIASERPT